MAKVTANGQTFEAADGTRLVNAIEDAGIDILHRCGGHARCTTCRVSFNEGEPADYHPREKAKLEDGGNLGKFRLSCHILCDGDMDVDVLMTLASSGLDDPGSRPDDEIPAE
ncbi:MAG: (2Fe-2S)-binding protein [Anaerolineales bacterium]|nr:(2Fe-2S)-binding protein [Anaerolineales bacterium]MCB0009907.1 (2Fe-2S)-binding protein [Anaerolineales bacterium]